MAESVATVREATATVFTVNVALDLPAAMLTEAGTVAWVLLLASLTTMPPFGAGPLSVTVPVAGVPPDKSLGFTAIEATVGELTVRDAVRLVPL